MLPTGPPAGGGTGIGARGLIQPQEDRGEWCADSSSVPRRRRRRPCVAGARASEECSRGLPFSLILACGLAQAPLGAAPPPVPAAPAIAAPTGPVAAAPWPGMAPFATSAVAAAPQRPRAVEMSDAHHLRLTIQYFASFLTLPLFVTEYVIGCRLYRDPPGSRTLRSGRATRGMDRLGIRRDGANLVVDTDRYYRQGRDAAGWDAAFVTL
jgi:hypothetical protein